MSLIHFHMANDALNDNLIFRPGFQVVNVRCIVIVAEFKPKSRNSAVKSNLVKLGKQMKLVYNDLIEKRVPKPITYRLLCQGKNLHTCHIPGDNDSRFSLISVVCSQLLQLPELAIPFGKTNLTLQQVRTFNEAQRLEYEVHKSDCR